MTFVTRILFFVLFFALPFGASAFYAPLEHLREESTSVLHINAHSAESDGFPLGAMRVRLLPISLKASCEGDVQVKYIRVRRIGAGDSSDIRRVYLLKGYRRLTRGVPLSGDDHSALLRFRRFVVRACHTERIDVAVDFSRSAAVGGRFAFEIGSAADVVSTAVSVKGDFPLRSSEKIEQVTPEAVGTATVTFVSPGNIKTMTEDTLARFYIDASSDKHQLLYAITLTNEGSGGKGRAKDDDLRDMFITRKRGRPLTSVVGKMDGDEVHFQFLRPYFLPRGQKFLFELRGHAYTSEKVVSFTLKESEDLVARSSRRGGRSLGTRKRMRR